MADEKFIFTSESVTEGHPDKVCDQISDTILDEVLTQDGSGRVACEVMVTRTMVLVSGEITARCRLNVPVLVRDVLRDIGYTRPEYGFNAETATVLAAIQEQSGDIARGVDTGGAGDQGMMFGYASDETEELMPLPIHLAHRLSARLAAVRKDGLVGGLRPDGKSQVSVRYENGVPREVTCVVIAAQHDPEVSLENLRPQLVKEVVNQVVPEKMRAPEMKIFINPTGLFVLGGPVADTGLTGRKIIVDTYGGYGRHGGGAFSGKDPSKVDRSASYMARYLARNIVSAGLCRRCEIQIAYAIGEPQPVSLNLETYGTGRVSAEKVLARIRSEFDLSPAGIIKRLDLLKPRYRPTSAYGHFGRCGSGFTWEQSDAVEVFRTLL